jgi:hypothetical protein
MTASANDAARAGSPMHDRSQPLPVELARVRRMNGATIKVICALGPASREPDIMSGLDARGVELFRINLSHASSASTSTGPCSGCSSALFVIPQPTRF